MSNSGPINVPAADLIQRCRCGEKNALDQLFQRYRHYLHLLAEAQLGRHLRAKCDASDIVQQSLLEAYRDFAGFHGAQEGELLAWLRQILAHNLCNEARRFAAQQRDAAREISLEQVRAGVDHSSLALGRCLAAEGPTPSSLAAQHEASLRLAETLARLPANYQQVIVLRVFEGLSAEEVAQRMDSTAGAVRMLQLRALTALRAELARERDSRSE
jgi:RNA polymerase sigma-70 factor (ECF subfamily)